MVLLCALLGPEIWQRALVWLTAVAVADLGLTVLDRRFRNANPPDSELEKWGWARAVALGARGAAWSLGPILLYTENNAVSLIIPVWGIINLIAASAYTAAPFFPCLIATVVAGLFPAAVWMAYRDTEVAHIAALLLFLSLPFVGFLGMLGRRNVGALISGQLDLADALENQRQQTRIVEQSLAERTRFFSAASHDLRQPLHALEFYTSLLAAAGDDSSRGEIVDRLGECTSNLNRQFNAILGIAETDAVVQRARIVATPLELVLRRVAASIRPEADLKQLKVRIAPTSLWGMIAPEILERILINLAANAVRYTAAGGILLGVRRRNDTAVIWVVDTGIGIAEEHRQNIFDEYYQVGNSARRPERGFGLGLAIVRRLCTSMQWPLDFRSMVNKGSGFGVAVPLAAPGLPLHESTPLATMAKVAVLVVDDDPLVTDAMGRLIASWGVHVETCRSGEQAVAILQARDVSFRWEALVDYRLSEPENGLAVIDRIRHDFGSGVGTTLMTAETDSSILQRAADAGIGVLRKPVKPIRLRALLAAPMTQEPDRRHAAPGDTGGE